jgi:hypothetical protein
VTSRTQCIEEFLGCKEPRIMEIGDFKAARQKNLNLFNDPISYNLLIKNKSEHIKLKFGLDKIVDKYIQTWKSISQQN